MESEEINKEDCFCSLGVSLSIIKNYCNTFKITAYQIVSIHLISGVSSEGEVSVLSIQYSKKNQTRSPCFLSYCLCLSLPLTWDLQLPVEGRKVVQFESKTLITYLYFAIMNSVRNIYVFYISCEFQTSVPLGLTMLWTM